MSNSAACREVGINRRTGTRWRYGRKEVDQTGRERVYAPITEERHRDGTSDRFLAEDERLVSGGAGSGWARSVRKPSSRR